MKKNITRKKKEKSGDSLREKSDSLKKKKKDYNRILLKYCSSKNLQEAVPRN